MKEKICVTIDTEILKKIDQRRGIIPRATYLNEEIRKAITSAVMPSTAKTADAANPHQ